MARHTHTLPQISFLKLTEFNQRAQQQVKTVAAYVAGLRQIIC